MEIWKDIPEYENLYQASNLGRIKSLISKNKILKGHLNKKGYIRISLYRNGISKTYQVHRLVALTFLENPNNYPVINHKDENKQNNSVENLEWCTVKYNTNYGNGIKKQVNKRKRKIIQYDKNGKYIKTWDGLCDAEYELEITRKNIHKCCNNKRKTAGGFVWKYASMV